MKKLLSVFLVAALLLCSLPAALAEHIWQKGDIGEEVRRIQTRLIELQYLEGEPTGEFDDATETAVLAFQSCNRLLQSGMVDSRTWDVLFSENAISFYESRTSMVEEELYESGAIFSAFAAMAPSATGIPNVRSGMAKESFSWNTNEYTLIRENGFQSVAAAPLSTFAVDVDTASYAQLRALILSGRRVPADAVRIEEMLNYFHYDYAQPNGDSPFGVTMMLAPCPWNEETLLLQIGLQAKTITPEERPRHNLVFLIDVSGSMFGADRLDLVKRAFMLLLDDLQPEDTISIVTYASRDEVVLEGVPAADKVRIMEAISALEAGGSTNSAAGIQTAYQIAERYAVEGGVNRVIMATDGDFNVGISSEGELARLIMQKKEGGVT